MESYTFFVDEIYLGAKLRTSGDNFILTVENIFVMFTNNVEQYSAVIVAWSDKIRENIRSWQYFWANQFLGAMLEVISICNALWIKRLIY